MSATPSNNPGVAVVIGSASGIGKATALAYARNGARGLVVADLDEPGVRQTAEQARQTAVHPGFDVVALHADVRVYESVEKVFEVAVARFGRVDYSVTTAGIARSRGAIAENPLDDYDNIQETNAKGVLHHTKAAVRVMLKQELEVIQGPARVRQLGRGAIVNTCSIAGLAGPPGMVEYVASKFAAVGITKVAANEYASSQIRINGMCPGSVETPLLERFLGGQPEARAATINSTPLRRIADVDEVADAILFLTGVTGSFVTGTAMVVDGGYLNAQPSLLG